MTKKIYLDHAATTAIDKKVFQKMQPYFFEKYGNPSSLHLFGREVLEEVEKSREKIANFFGAKKEEIIFTSGATEANNLAIKGTVREYYKNGEDISLKPHIITTAFEHHCVLESIENLKKENLIEVDYIFPDKEGIVSVEKIQKALRSNTILVSIMFVNNEIGTVQPIAKIGKMIAKLRAKKMYPLFHTDATQAVAYFDCAVQKLGVDLLSMSAHKIYGPKGVGMLYFRKGIKIQRIQDGGSQESGKRAGTLNTSGIIGLGEAIYLLNDKKTKKINAKIKSLRDYLIEKILKEIPNSSLNGSKIKRSPSNANISFYGTEGESLLFMLDAEGIAVSTGSACSSGSLSPSHVLLAIGKKPEEAHSSIRFTLGKSTTKKEIEITVQKLKIIVENLRKISGNILRDYYKKDKK